MFAPVRALGRSAAKPGERHSTEREQADQSPRLARRRRSQLEEQPQDPLRRKALLAIDLAPMLNSDRSALGVKVGAKRLASAGRQAERSQMIPELPVEIPSIPDLPSDENEEPGSMDLMLGFEEALPRFSAAAEEITRAIHEISQIMT